MSENRTTKKVSLSNILEDLNNGLTRWKKDDIGFGSLEKKYNLTPSEAVQLFAHPKIKNVESMIPAFVIVDDLPDDEPEPEKSEEDMEKPAGGAITIEGAKVVTEVQVAAPRPQRQVPKTTVIVEEEEQAIVPFI